MWFLVTTNQKPNFYLPDGTSIEVADIELTNHQMVNGESVYCDPPIIADVMQAISVLFEVGVKGYGTKSEAKEAGKTLPQGKWKYLRIN